MTLAAPFVAAPFAAARLAAVPLAAAALVAFAAPAVAGDAAAGEKTFAKCRACHMVVSDAGDVIVKGGKQGPNLWGVIGRTAVTQAEFAKYGDALNSAGEKGLVLDEANLAEYTADPKTFLRTFLDDKKARSKMAYKLKSGGEDVAAFLAQHGAGS